MKTEIISETYTFKLLDTALPDMTMSFEPALGKPAPRAQAALHALELTVNYKSRIELWLGKTYISTIGRKT